LLFAPHIAAVAAAAGEFTEEYTAALVDLAALHADELDQTVSTAALHALLGLNLHQLGLGSEAHEHHKLSHNQAHAAVNRFALHLLEKRSSQLGTNLLTLLNRGCMSHEISART